MTARAWLGYLLCAGMLAAGVAPAARGQGGATDSVLARARQLAGDGNAAAGRALVNSVMAGETPGSPAYVDALFTRASIAESADAARKDYARIAVEFSNSPHAEDALLRLAQMALAGGDRVVARQYLERLVLEYPAGALRAQGAYWLGRVLIDDGAMPAACASLARAKSFVTPADVELANQINYYSRPCTALQRAADSARADSLDRAMKAARADSIARASAAAKKKAKASGRKVVTAKEPAKPQPAGGREAGSPGASWSAQVAAYDTPDKARDLARKLSERGFETRVTDQKPFRVRIGRYASRADAAALVAKLKQANIAAFVVEAEKP